jgi:hypothetical protein
MPVFQGAPVLQGLSVLTLISTYTLSSSDAIYLDVVDITTRLQLYRMLSSQMAFRNTAQVVVGLIVLYSCREFERQMGYIAPRNGFTRATHRLKRPIK